ncbi:MAG TPA: gliding motility protein [Polyangiaceae bacterium]|nr:gliding motility protein [Polyangiaceae bacterium]
MPVVNPLAREVVFKVVYYGPGLGGKTTSLQHVHATTRPEHRGKMVSLATPVDRTLYFDFLPIRLPSVHGMGVRLQLFTVPGQVYYNATRKLVLTGADGLVMVFDSQGDRIDANSESLENLHENLTAHGRSLADVPHVIQYNKRDLSDALPISELEQRYNRLGAPSFGSVAMTGEGVYEALEAVTRAVLERFEERLPERADSIPGLSLPEGGLAAALRGADPDDGWDQEPDRRGSVELRLSQLPEHDPGEAAARVVVGELAVSQAPEERTPRPISPAPPPPPRLPSHGPSGVSFEPLWPLGERGFVRELERALATGDFSRAFAECETLVARSLAGAASALGNADAPRDPATVALVLGIDGKRYLEFRSLAREARAGRGVTAAEALVAFALAIEIRIARSHIG